jgi:hypothetical protein
MKRGIRVALVTTALATAALLGLTACGPADAVADLSPEASALTAMGFTTEEVDPGQAAPTDDADAGATGGQQADRKKAHPAARHRLRVMLRRNVLHGEATVQTRNGVKVIEVQRGTVTAVDGSTVTVRSTDGFVGTWTLGDALRVFQNRQKVSASDIKVGETIGIAGVKDGGTVTARLVVIRAAK